MKHLLLFTLMSAFPITARTQPLLDQSSAPVPGNSYSYQVADFITITGTGAGQTWDLSSAAVTGTTTASFIDPAASSAGASFPDCDVAFYSPQNEYYTDVSAIGLYMLGQYNPIYTITAVYTDPYLYQAFPCAMGNAWTDIYSGSYDYSGTTYSLSGSGTFTATGYGTLQLPWGLVANVLRLDAIESYTETGGGSVYVYNAQSVYFYKPGIGYFVVKAIDASATLNGASAGTAQNLFYMDEASIGIAETAATALGVQVVPNPSNDQATVLIAATGIATLDIINVEGRVVLHRELGTLSPGISSELVDVSALPSGVYNAAVANVAGERGSQRFTVVH